MRVARSGGLSARALLVAALTLGFLSAPASAATADTLCDPMKPKMQAAYRALENRQYTAAYDTFGDSEVEYLTCAFYSAANPSGASTYVPEYWLAYAIAGKAAAKFGDGSITDGLKYVKEAADEFDRVIAGTGIGPAASASLHRSANEGLAYVRLLESAKKPLLPKIWLDWRAAHPR